MSFFGVSPLSSESNKRISERVDRAKKTGRAEDIGDDQKEKNLLLPHLARVRSIGRQHWGSKRTPVFSHWGSRSAGTGKNREIAKLSGFPDQKLSSSIFPDVGVCCVQPDG